MNKYEIRRVPPDWVHPKSNGKYIPLSEQVYDHACEKWYREAAEWKPHGGMKWYHESYAGNPPNEADYRRRRWKAEEATHFQCYEVEPNGKGIPVSPVFPDEAPLREFMGDAL